MENGTTGGNITHMTAANITNGDDGYDDATFYLLNTGFLSLIPLGLIGNGLSFVVMVQMVEISAFYIYLAVLAFSDCMLMLFGMLPRWMQQSGFYPLFPTSYAYVCSMGFYPLTVFSQYSALITAAATIERYIVIAYPLKAERYCSRKRTVLYLVITFIFIAAINFPGVCWHWNDDYTHCLFPDITDYYCSEFLLFVDLFLYFITPASVIILFNTLIIRKLYSARKRRHALTNPAGTQQTARAAEHDDVMKQTIIILFLVTVAFIITLLPLVIGILLSVILDMNKTFEDLPIFTLVIDMFSLFNHTFNFILYGLSGQMFRKKLCGIVCCRNTT